MAARIRFHTRTVLFILVALLLAAWLLPRFFSADRYRRRLEARLEATLGRRVVFGAVSFHLLPRPGFSLEDVGVEEDPKFGTEPFARSGEVDCRLQWRALWRGRLDCAGLRLESVTLNVVRDTQGEWNVQQLLHQAGKVPHAASGPSGGPLQSLDLETEDARLNFTIGGNKKPFAITDVTAQLVFDTQSRRAQFRFTGSPIRTDLALPTPGPISVTGDWAPTPDGAGRLNAALEARGALVYDWVPLLTGRNPGIYGVLDADVHLDGSYPLLEINGQGRITQVHRWGSIPPADSMPVDVDLRGRLDRSRGRVLVDAMEVSFDKSRVRVTGALDQIPDSPRLDLVAALEPSRLEDLAALGRRLWGGSESYDLSGAANGLLMLKGSWAERSYGGSFTARDVRLKTRSGAFPVSNVALRIDDQGIHLAPIRITLAPRVEVVAEGIVRGRTPAGREPTQVATGSHRRPPAPMTLGRAARAQGQREVPSGYEVALSAKSVPLHDVLQLARAEGVAAAREIDARGSVTANLRLAGGAWPFTPPVLSGAVDLREARLIVPGLTVPIDVTRARIEIAGQHVTVDPISASLGSTAFAGRLLHDGPRERPWTFDLRTAKLNWSEGAGWFDALGRTERFNLLDYIPGLRSLAARRSAGANLFAALNAKGRFAAGTLSYRNLTLSQLSARVEISGRVVRASNVTFRAAGGSGRGSARVDLTTAPAKITGSVAILGAKVQTWAAHFPSQLRKARGRVTASAQFQTRGLSRREWSENLEGQANAQLKDFSFGGFDPCVATARAAGWGTLAPARADAVLRSARASLGIARGRVNLQSLTLPLSGAQFVVTGHYGFNGAVDIAVRADFAHLKRRWSNAASEVDPDPDGHVALLHVTGPLERPAVEAENAPSRAHR